MDFWVSQKKFHVCAESKILSTEECFVSYFQSNLKTLSGADWLRENDVIKQVKANRYRRSHVLMGQ